MRKRISFDTSAINALAEDDGLLAAIKSGFFTRLTFPSVEEPLATSNETKRNRLFDILNALRINGECLQAHNTIATQLIQNYEQHRSSQWASQDIRFVECETAIARRDFSNIESDEQRTFAQEAKAQFAKVFADTRPEFEELFAAGTDRPATADQLLAHLNGTDGAFWNIAAGLYERASGHRPTEEQIRAFTADCQPFFALMLGLVHAQFEWGIRETQVNENKRVNRVDLFSAIYLPYCDIYITNDLEQKRCVAEITSTANLPVEVFSLREFGDRMTVSVGKNRSANPPSRLRRS